VTVHVPIEARQCEGKRWAHNSRTFQRRVDRVFFRGHSRDGVRLKDFRWFVGFLALEFRPLIGESEGRFPTEGEQDLGLVAWDICECHRPQSICNGMTNPREYPAAPAFHCQPARKVRDERCSEGPSLPSCTSFVGEPQR
jgi:hypothetical protein